MTSCGQFHKRASRRLVVIEISKGLPPLSKVRMLSEPAGDVSAEVI